jgi:hypothetical protein
MPAGALVERLEAVLGQMRPVQVLMRPAWVQVLMQLVWEQLLQVEAMAAAANRYRRKPRSRRSRQMPQQGCVPAAF